MGKFYRKKGDWYILEGSGTYEMVIFDKKHVVLIEVYRPSDGILRAGLYLVNGKSLILKGDEYEEEDIIDEILNSLVLPYHEKLLKKIKGVLRRCLSILKRLMIRRIT